jgi:hypothetical protein
VIASLRTARAVSLVSSVGVRFLVVVIGVCALTGCARDVVMRNPRTGETKTCRANSLNPWAKQDACIGDHIARGWIKAGAANNDVREANGGT